MERGGEDIVFCGEKMDRRHYDGPLWPFLRECLISHGSRIALVNPDTKEEVGYGRVLSLAERLSRGLYKLGMGQGTVVCFCAPNSIPSILLTLATMAVRATLHPVNPMSVPGEIRRQVDLTEARMMVTTPQLLPHVQQAVSGTSVRILIIGPRNGLLNYEDVLALGTEDVAIETTPEDPGSAVAALLFSSGTTGLPKGVEITERNIRAWAHISTVMAGGLSQTQDVVVVIQPLFEVSGFMIRLINLVKGAKSVVMAALGLDDYLALVACYKTNKLHLRPAMVVRMLNHPKPSDFDLSFVRVAICSTAPMGRETEAQFVRRFGVKCLQVYGMTENFVATACTPGSFRSGSSGKPIPGTEIKIVDSKTGKSLGMNQEGVLHMRGPLQMRGYFKDPEATKATIDSDGWLDSGDIARFDSDGFLFIVDRQKEMIKFEAEQVSPSMLEDVLLSHPAISDACVIGRSDTAAGELPMAFVVMATGHSLTAQQVQEFVAARVPSYMRLRGGVEFIKEIPKNPNGKILRRILREEFNQVTTITTKL